MEKGLAPKVEALYQAIMALFAEGADLNTLTVAEIARKAGIGKGTVYEYFDNKEEMIAGAIYYFATSSCKRMYEKLEEKESLHERMRLFFDLRYWRVQFLRAFVPLLLCQLQRKNSQKKFKHARPQFTASFGKAAFGR